MSAIISYLFDGVTPAEAIMNVFIAIVGLAILISMWRLHYANSRYNNFNVVSLLTNSAGYLDGAKCMEMGAFLLLSWGFVAQVTAGKLSDAYTTAFVGAFAMRGAFGAYLRSKGEPPLQEGTTTVIESNKKTTEVISTPPNAAPLKESI